MNGRRKKPSADGAKKAEKHLESKHADEFKNGDGTTVPRSTGTLHTLSPKRRRQLESAFGVRPRGDLSWVEAELLHTARAVKLLKPANWAEKWRHIRNVPLAEAVALSLGYEPEQPELMKLAKYRKRLKLAIRCLGEPHRFPDQNWERLPVDLTEFAVWAKSVDWDNLPDELKELTASSKQSSQLSDARARSNRNLRPATPSVTDEQIIEAIKGRTRAEAAKHLGISERNLYRRLAKRRSK
jgi:DNA-binding NtrC family response regulator